MGVIFSMAFNTFSFSQDSEINNILSSFAKAYKTDPMALSVTFGIQVKEDWWHIHANRKQEAYKTGKEKQYTFHNLGPHEVVLHKGQPEEPTWYFKFADKSVLEKVNDKTWSAGTASMRTFGTDEVALDNGFMNGFQTSPKVEAIIYQVLEHFWKKDNVEIVSFSRDESLPTHGVSAVSLYTMKDKRIAWFSINKEEAANDDPRMDKGQVPNLFIFTKGKGKALFDDKEIEIKAGMSVFIGPYVKHTIFNPYDEPLEGILVLFGDNIDFALGQSYLDFLDKQYQFLEDNRMKK
jgi:mannose-6-phosphate isomerase-like protein (cupin superfamily)